MDRKRTFNCVVLTAVLLIGLSGCGTVRHSLDLEKDYLPKAGTTVEVGKVSNETGQKFDVPVEDMLRDALVDALKEEDLSGPASGGPNVTTNCRIVAYEKGSAFKRWLMPGWGATELAIQCDLLDASSVVGTVNATRSVTAGGLYTVGAWEKVFTYIASDVAGDIREKFAVVRQ